MKTDKERKDVRKQIVFAPSDIEAIEQWRRNQPGKLLSESAAIRELIHLGINASKKEAT